MKMSMLSWTTGTDIAAHLTTCVAGAAAAFWFVFTANYRRKISFEVSCKSFRGAGECAEKLVELLFELQNKGEREHRCYTLAYEVESGEWRAPGSAPVFLRRSGNIVVKEAEYYYVRSGVTQRVSAHLWIPAGVDLVRVRGFILHKSEREEIRADKSVFEEMLRFDDWTSVDRFFEV